MSGGGKYWERAWTLVEGCTPVSAGCKHCWARSLHQRFQAGPFDTVRWREDRLEVPLRRRKPAVYSVWNDLFHAQVPSEFITRAFAAMAACPRHVFLVLTKRPGRLADWLPGAPALPDVRGGNIWLGASIEHQEVAAGRLRELRRASELGWPTWVSFEPLLGPVVLPAVAYHDAEYPVSCWLDWLVIGCETGPGARDCREAWVRGLVQQADEAGVPVWVKQLQMAGLPNSEPAAWPEDLRRRQLPFVIGAEEVAG